MISDGVVWNRGKHNWRFGGDYRRISQNFQSARNAEGSFVFTGFATGEYLPGSARNPVTGTGSDFADYLSDCRSRRACNPGTSSYQFLSNAYDFYGQNDWRVLANLSLNLGLRYEYNGPFVESQNQIANLDVSPGYTNAVAGASRTDGAVFGNLPKVARTSRPQ